MSANDTVSPRVLSWTAAAEAEWENLYRAQLPRVYNFFRYRVGCTADAEDLTARTFEKAWRARHRYRRDLAGFSTWLFTIARHVAIDHFRSRRPAAPLEAAREIASPTPTPEQDASLGQQAERLSRLLEHLPAREREILALKYGAEMTNRAIAAATGLSESNVGTILQRTLLRLRNDWHGHGPEERDHDR